MPFAELNLVYLLRFSLHFFRENNVGKSRALDNLGRVYAKNGEYDRAIDKWMEKMPLVKAPLESTWLFHEIGRCHLELKNFQDAKEYGQKSLAAARDADDQVWQLNATVLIAQAEGIINYLAFWICLLQGFYDLVVQGSCPLYSLPRRIFNFFFCMMTQTQKKQLRGRLHTMQHVMTNIAIWRLCMVT